MSPRYDHRSDNDTLDAEVRASTTAVAVRAALAAEREETARTLASMGDEFAIEAEEAENASIALVLSARASAYRAAAEIVRARGKVVLG